MKQFTQALLLETLHCLLPSNTEQTPTGAEAQQRHTDDGDVHGTTLPLLFIWDSSNMLAQKKRRRKKTTKETRQQFQLWRGL